MNLIVLLILVAVVFYLGMSEGARRSNPTHSASGNPIEYGSLQEKPWYLTPFNQPGYMPERNANRRIFDVDPQPWDVKNDPEYYLADLQQRYPTLQLRSDLV